MNYHEICFSSLDYLHIPILLINQNCIIEHINTCGKYLFKKLEVSNLNISTSSKLKIPKYFNSEIKSFIDNKFTELITEKKIIINNDIFYYKLRMTKILNCPKNTNMIFVTITDITEQKHAKEILKENILELKTLFKALPDTYLKFNRHGTLLSCINHQEDTIHSSQDFVGKNLDDILPYKISLKFKSEIIKSIKTKSLIVFEYKLNVPKKGLNSFEARLIPLSDKEVISIVRNLTQKKRTEEELLKMEKLNSISTLAGGVAHDFNNILTIILGNISMLKTNINSKNKILKKLTHIEKIILQAKNLTKQLLSLSKGSNPLKKACYINSLIKETTSLSLSGSNVSPKIYIPNDLWPVEVDVSQINQVLSNLIINSCQAMPNGGIITIRCRNVNLKENEVIGLSSGNYITISVKDQGHGISQENLLKVFDPYFTTKETGMGLGLFSAYSIVKKHNGQIVVKSKLGKGTIFQIYLPACDIIPMEIEAPSPKIIHGKSNILVMDDEYEIRRILYSMLMFLGHTVTLSKDGTEAIELYKNALNSGNPFDLVIMDLTIPGGMGGEETIKHLLKIDSNVKAIVSSGYSSGGVIGNYKKHGFKGVINKPYTIEELSNELNNVLSSC
ncbi:histidine kinase [Clostridium botulinum]|uniref:Stage 0 sporulation protein A homolog n=1 Tax=Clostridium botulinum C/D str. DC5 TaxID=1443128 RepID=A0A0A0ID56_CLOBO|nr:ATP-binding protein [Clostridium botulinum]KEI06636.1 histidine kinase [Clostridium botulinum C/D str. BKT75002]KEI09548.1 histidine kinase [Clostridium botulinum C/D str. BKT2873]KGM98872.1 histidine kinase [Clostridium botulinum C/D str. DC5]KOC55536.1 histidine kinase [Clostridium botulinum]KOC56332.1 histidine kinase [Clostridium botulinum]